MFSNKIIILHFIIILLNVITQSQTLDELPIVEDNDIAIVEAAIRDTVNNLFAAFKIDKSKHSQTLKQYSTIYNVFISITLQDCNNLKEIARLTRVNNIDNNTHDFIAQINEVLTEDDKSHEGDDKNNGHVSRYINLFISKLKYLKDMYLSDNNTVINDDILKYLESQSLNSVTDRIRCKLNGNNENILSDNEFWQPSGRRIYDGIRTNIKKFPFMASIKFFGKFQCAGSIIKDDLVITSASCLQLAWNNRFFRENPTFLSVQIGSDTHENGGENIPVLEIHFHLNYDPRYLKNNLALMRLWRKINFRSGKRVKKIDFDRNPWPMAINPHRILIVGWGAKAGNNVIQNAVTNMLSYAELDYYPVDDCQEHYSEEFVTKTNFCAGFYTKGSGACNRDAGGPAIVDGILMGVISFGAPTCGSPDSPTVFTKVGYYADWIETIMEQPNRHQRSRITEPPDTMMTDISSEQITRTTYTVTPIMNHRHTPSPIYDAEIARTQEDKGFKNFLSTIFSSQEIEEYLNMDTNEVLKSIFSDAEGDEVAETLTNTTTQTNSAELEYTTKEPISDTTTTTLDLDNLFSDEISNENTKESKKAVTVMENARNEDQNLETDIMNLVNNLDENQFMMPEVSFDKKYINQDNKKLKDKNKIENKTSNMNEKAEDEKRELTYTTFEDLTFRAKSNNNEIKQEGTLSSIAKLLAMLINDETNKEKP